MGRPMSRAKQAARKARGGWRRLAALGAVAIIGCSGTVTSSKSNKVSCHTNADCLKLGAGDQCVLGVCAVPNGATLPPSQGAVAESISPSTSGAGCQATTGEFTAPANFDPSTGTHASLFCDLSASNGCKPDANVVVDGDNGAGVNCTVSGDGTTFNLTASLEQGDVVFDVQGSIGPSGGKAFVSSNHALHGLQDPQCDIFIESNQGQIKAGAIWAAFDCSSFNDISVGQTGCTASGKFIFENCGK
jgi:hypothetical protein